MLLQGACPHSMQSASRRARCAARAWSSSAPGCPVSGSRRRIRLPGNRGSAATPAARPRLGFRRKPAADATRAASVPVVISVQVMESARDHSPSGNASGSRAWSASSSRFSLALPLSSEVQGREETVQRGTSRSTARCLDVHAPLRQPQQHFAREVAGHWRFFNGIEHGRVQVWMPCVLRHADRAPSRNTSIACWTDTPRRSQRSLRHASLARAGNTSLASRAGGALWRCGGRHSLCKRTHTVVRGQPGPLCGRQGCLSPLAGMEPSCAVPCARPRALHPYPGHLHQQPLTPSGERNGITGEMYMTEDMPKG